jgi:hypothetical protein
MNAGQITMDPEAAKIAFKEYRAALKSRHSVEDKQLVTAYRALSKGHALINLIDALNIAGFDAQSRPKIAVVRADADEVFFHSWSTGFSLSLDYWERELESRRTITIPWSSVDLKDYVYSSDRFKAKTPIIPPRFRPKGSLVNYYVLFEPVWESAPKPDPILLKRLNRYTFAVLAQWDLTEVELMVIRGR